MILLSCFRVLSSQEFSSVNYSISDGLPSNETYHITQDDKGYIWIATDRGPTRFDGTEFKIYGTKDGLPDPTVFRIIPMGDTILFRCFNEKIYALINDSVYLLPVFNKLASKAQSLNLTMGGIAVDSSNQLLIGYNSFKGNSAICFKFENLKSYRQEYSNIASHSRASCIVQFHFSNENKSILSFHNFMNREDSVHIIFPDTNFYLSLPKRTSRAFYDGIKLGKKHYLFFCGKVLYELKNNKIKTVIPYFKQEIIPGSFSALGANSVAFGNRDVGMSILTRNNDTENWSLLNTKGLTGASNTFIDKEGSLWVSTLGLGVYKIPNQHIKNLPIQEHGNRRVNTLSISKGFLWAGLSSGELLKFDMERPNDVSESYHDKIEIFDTQFIRDTLWASYVGLDNDDCQLLHEKINYFQSNTGLSSVNSQNNIWIGGNHFTSLFNTRTLKLKKYQIAYKTRLTLELPDKNLLLATLNGLLVAQLDSSKLQVIRTSLKGYRISYIEPNIDGTYLISTIGQGLLLYNYLNDSILDQFNMHQSVDYSNVTYIKKGVDNFWIATNKGIAVVKIDPISSTIKYQKSITNIDGLISNVVNQIDFDSTNVYVATNKGISYFDSSLTFNNPIPPDIYIYGIETFGDTNFTISSNQELDWNHNNLKIEYIGLSYKTGNGATYSYRLLGNSNDSVLTNESSVSFLNLRPGNYQFEVFAFNNSGMNSLEAATFNFTILPPFYKTWWFYSLMILFILLLVFVFYRLQINRLNRINKNKIAFNELRQKALIAQMNPHFIFNSMNSILSLIMENRNDVAEDYLTKFSGLLRNALNQSEEAYTPINEELMISKEYIRLENMRFNFSITCRINIADNIDQNKTLVPSLLLQTLAENAILHGIIPAQKTGIIDLRVTKKSENLLLIKVIDNGIGLDASKKLKSSKPQTHTSKGTNILRARVHALAQIHNLDCAIEFKDTGNGTEVTLCVPLSTDLSR